MEWFQQNVFFVGKCSKLVRSGQCNLQTTLVTSTYWIYAWLTRLALCILSWFLNSRISFSMAAGGWPGWRLQAVLDKVCWPISHSPSRCSTASKLFWNMCTFCKRKWVTFVEYKLWWCLGWTKNSWWDDKRYTISTFLDQEFLSIHSKMLVSDKRA